MLSLSIFRHFKFFTQQRTEEEVISMRVSLVVTRCMAHLRLISRCHFLPSSAAHGSRCRLVRDVKLLRTLCLFEILLPSVLSFSANGGKFYTHLFQ